MKFYENWKARHTFNAENCRRKQTKFEEDRYEQKLEDIKARIDFVVTNSNDEHAVIYCVRKNDKEMYQKISDYFYNLGFSTIITKIEGLDNEYLIINW